MAACQHSDRNRVINILLVEDDESDFVLIEQLLTELYDHDHYRLGWTPNVDKARAEMETRVYDVYLIDNNLGASSGISLISELAEEGFVDIPVILLTELAVKKLISQQWKLGQQIIWISLLSLQMSLGVLYATALDKKSQKCVCSFWHTTIR